MGISHMVDAGIAEVVMDNPPVTALTVAGWYELADTITTLGDDPNVRVVVLRAEGRGGTLRRWVDSFSAPRVGVSTPGSTSRRCNRPTGSAHSSAPTAAVSRRSP